MAIRSLKDSSALCSKDINQKIIAGLINRSSFQEEIVKSAIKSKSLDPKAKEIRWNAIKSGNVPLTLNELSDVLKALKENDLDINLDIVKAKKTSIFNQQAFYDSLRDKVLDTKILSKQLQAIKDSSKREKGFLTKAFNIFSDKKPIDKILKDVVSFDKYCQSQGVKFDEVNKSLHAGKKPKTMSEKLWEFRFLLAAVGGVSLGALGVNMTDYPGFSKAPGAFFGALPYIALPFISLNIFRAFSQKSIFEEVGTFARFTGMMATGFLISLGVASAMSGYLPDISSVQGLIQEGKDAVNSFNPSAYILHGIGLAAAMATVYKFSKSAKDKLKDVSHKSIDGVKGRLSSVFNKSAIAVTDKIVKAGNVTNKAADFVDKAFSHYMNVIGLPAIFAVTSSSIATLGIGELSTYGGLYASISLGFAGAAGFLAAASYAYGARKKEFKEIFKTASTAFGISSSAATMPVTKESLKKIGVSAKTRNSVVPLGANFNMMGTSLYLGSVAASASVMFGQDPSLIDRAAIMGLCILTAFGAPGAPASTIIFLEPVFSKMGLSTTMASKMYEIIMPIDRPADMIQTSVNVTGDMVVAMGKDLRFKKARIQNIKQIREKREQDSLKVSPSI